MHDFALVSEGPTDHPVLRNILLGFFKGQGEPVINREHPNPLAERAFGGWTLLLQYLREKKFKQAFQLNRYLIIQVDTDVSADPGFDVAHRTEAGPLTVDQLVAAVVQQLRDIIGDADWRTYGDRFIFAIAVHQIECWLLPLWYDDEAHAAKTTGCLSALGAARSLQKELKERKFRFIRAEEKDVRSYDEASKGYRKLRNLEESGRRNPSLALFLEELSAKRIVLAEEP